LEEFKKKSQWPLLFAHFLPTLQVSGSQKIFHGKTKVFTAHWV
jgi:hypothetical protein